MNRTYINIYDCCRPFAESLFQNEMNQVGAYENKAGIRLQQKKKNNASNKWEMRNYKLRWLLSIMQWIIT